MLLARILIQRARTHAIRQRTLTLATAFGIRNGLKQAHRLKS
jgi:hypothetical protein